MFKDEESQAEWVELTVRYAIIGHIWLAVLTLAAYLFGPPGAFTVLLLTLACVMAGVLAGIRVSERELERKYPYRR